MGRLVAYLNFSHFKKWSLLIFLALIFIAFFGLRLHHYLNLATFEHYQLLLQNWTNKHYHAAVTIYLFSFILLVACAAPCSAIFTFVGGFLFGFIAIFYAELSVTLGGLILFFAVKTSLGSHIATQSSKWIKKMEHGFQENAFRYLLILRLVPIFPCWISNIAAGALNVPLKTFINATILGALPATIILVIIGNQLDHFLIAKIHFLSQNAMSQIGSK